MIYIILVLTWAPASAKGKPLLSSSSLTSEMFAGIMDWFDGFVLIGALFSLNNKWIKVTCNKWEYTEDGNDLSESWP